jgi:DtxR family transcriptional regulator, Mn-dependent transcriptional regulator
MTENYSHTEQNYIKAIYHLSRNQEGTAYTQELATALATTPASVTDMVKKLSEKGILSYVPYRGARLSRRGEKTALGIIRRHRLWELFLHRVLKFKWDEVHAMAEELEHVSSDSLLNRIDEYLSYPKFDPHGDPIPDANGKLSETNFTRLSDQSKNQTSVIAAVSEHSPEFLKYLDETGLTLGSHLKVLKKYSFDNSVEIMLNGKKQLHISGSVAEKIYIKNSK